jgi:hypothetical protein
MLINNVQEMDIPKVKAQDILTYPIENRSNTSIKADWIQDSFIFKDKLGTDFDVKISTRKSYTDQTIVTRMVCGNAVKTADRIWFDSNAFIGKVTTLLEEKASARSSGTSTGTSTGNSKSNKTTARGNKKYLQDKALQSADALVDTTENEPGHAIRNQIANQHARAIALLIEC